MSTNVCPSCSTPFVPGATFCDNCGMDLRSLSGAPAVPVAPTQGVSGTGCPNCGANNVPGAAFCENCGMQLPPAAPPPVISLPTQAAEQPPAMSPGLPTLGAGAAPAANGAMCPNCGYINVPGASFCENCGTPIGQAAAPEPPAPPAPVPVAEAPVAPTPPPPQPQAVGFISGRLVIVGSSASLSIPEGKTVVTIGREDPVSGIFPDINLDPYGGHDAGVGRQHARLVINAGQLCIIDQSSVNGTFLNKQKIAPEQPKPLNDGDELRFGRLVLNYYRT